MPESLNHPSVRIYSHEGATKSRLPAGHSPILPVLCQVCRKSGGEPIWNSDREYSVGANMLASCAPGAQMGGRVLDLERTWFKPLQNLAPGANEVSFGLEMMLRYRAGMFVKRGLVFEWADNS